MHRALSAVSAAVIAASVASPSGIDAAVARSSGLAARKAHALGAHEETDPPPLLATLVQTHTDERVPLDDRSPTPERFSALLADRVTGEKHEVDPRLLDLLRALAKKHSSGDGAARIEIVSGYRSPKLNEMLRKKGHHVASHSQHSLGHACDFRIVEPPEVRGGAADDGPKGASNRERGVDPRVLEKEIRELGWDGGVGVYTTSTDWFVHADVGKNRRWNGQ